MDSAHPEGNAGEPAVSISDHDVAHLGAPIIDSLSLDESSNERLTSDALSFNMVQNKSAKQSTEERKKAMVEKIMQDETKKMLQKEASRPGYLKGTVSTEADTRFESLSEQNHKRTYESFRVTRQELKNSSSPMKRASVRKENKEEEGQQLKIGPNARIREERFRKQLMRAKAELKAEKNLRQEFEEKVAYLEGKVKGIELTLNREKKIVRRLQGIKSNNADTETKNQEQLLRSQTGNSKKDSNASKDPRHVEVLKDRLKDALYEAEKQRLEVRTKNEELARAYQTIKNLEHIIDSVRNNHTFKTLTGNKKKGLSGKGTKPRFGIEKQKVNSKQSIDKAKKNTHSKRPSPRGRAQGNSNASRSPRRNKSKSPLRRDGVKSKSPRHSPRRNPGNLKNNSKAYANVPQQSPKKITNTNNTKKNSSGSNLHRSASQNIFQKKRDGSNYRDRRLQKDISKSDSSLNAKKKQTGGNQLQSDKKKRMSQQSFLDHKNKRKPQAQQQRRYPRLQPVEDQEHEHFITVDTSKIKPMVGQMEGKMAKEQKAVLQAHRRALAQQHRQQLHDVDTDEDGSKYSREERKSQKVQSNDGSVVVASNGNVMLPQSIKAFAFGSHDAFSENATTNLEKEFEF